MKAVLLIYLVSLLAVVANGEAYFIKEEVYNLDSGLFDFIFSYQADSRWGYDWSRNDVPFDFYSDQYSLYLNGIGALNLTAVLFDWTSYKF